MMGIKNNFFSRDFDIFLVNFIFKFIYLTFIDPFQFSHRASRSPPPTFILATSHSKQNKI